MAASEGFLTVSQIRASLRVRRRVAALFLMTLGANLCGPVHAEVAFKQPWEEYEKLVGSKTGLTAQGTDLFGDSVDLESGALSFAATDIQIPTNHALPVAFTRTYSVTNRKGSLVNDLPLADWDIDVPRLGGVYATTWLDARCSNPNVPSAKWGGETFPSYDFWQGLKADMPGGGLMLQASDAAIRPNDGNGYAWVLSAARRSS